LETLHFYHPVVHWISRDVRNEREICCDRLALSITGGSRQEFAATLAQLGELREHPGALILAANGGVLFDRVQYMVLPEAPGTRKRAPARMVALLLGTAPLAIAAKGRLVPALDVTAAAFLTHFAPLRASLATAGRDDSGARAIEASQPLAPIATIPLKTLHIPPVVLPKMLAAMPKVAS